ncbi:hypothetical protein CGZ90_13225 [Fictibacillus aquaticus]|uniref:N-acetylmuramoyl-L-alanine amidase n=1 Tax=Fictibacillus aquaticus TaxID=2021314 RepID=A0A235F8P6_9BACL|nr:hypothetical protein CGZ90_13225 [Fictibacillus aquaticus]
MGYKITYDYIRKGNARPGDALRGPLFAVAHDTGNPGSTARENRTYFDTQQPSASAHVFIDDKEILVIIPLNEKAWHVQYDKPKDNQLFGDDANDAAIGVELCWGGAINFREAYKRYVWFFAWLCKKYKWDPLKKIVSHKTLDPERRSDPDNALSQYGKTFAQLLNDVKKEMEAADVPKEKPQVISPFAQDAHKWVTENGISDGSRPQDAVTRQEAWYMLQKVHEHTIREVQKLLDAAKEENT